jgi:hypothetical protein
VICVKPTAVVPCSYIRGGVTRTKCSIRAHHVTFPCCTYSVLQETALFGSCKTLAAYGEEMECRIEIVGAFLTKH